MGINLHHVSDKDLARLLTKRQQKWVDVNCGGADLALAAFLGYEPATVGFLRYAWGDRRLHTAGTYVDPRFRGAGIARALWYAMLDIERPREVEVATVSRAGKKFINNMKAFRPDIEWRHIS